MGVSDLPGCKPTDFLCRTARTAARAGVYSAWAQNNLVQAQYFRDHMRYSTYLQVNTFLADLNNESPDVKNQTYVDNLTALDVLVLVIFEKDKTVVPKESAWFGGWSIPDPDDENDKPEMLTMKQQPLYEEDWIGLKSLDEAGKVFLETCPTEHMHLPPDCWEWIVRKWVGHKQI
jgi:palmitoyl-protein thioesterase